MYRSAFLLYLRLLPGLPIIRPTPPSHSSLQADSTNTPAAFASFSRHQEPDFGLPLWLLNPSRKYRAANICVGFYLASFSSVPKFLALFSLAKITFRLPLVEIGLAAICFWPTEITRLPIIFFPAASDYQHQPAEYIYLQKIILFRSVGMKTKAKVKEQQGKGN